MKIFALLLAFGLSGLTGAAFAETPLIPRSELFGQGERMRVRISPDGKYLGWVAPIKGANGEVKGLGIYRAAVDNKDAVEPILVDNNPTMPLYSFTLRSDKIFFLRDVGGNENQQLYVIDVPTGKIENLTGDNKVKTEFEGQKPGNPDVVYFSMNKRDPQVSDTYAYDMKTGKTKMVYRNTQNFLGVMLDDSGVARIGVKYDKDGNMDTFYREPGKKWKLLIKASIEDATGTHVAGADFEKGLLYILDARGQDRSSLKQWNLRTGEITTLVDQQKADLESVVTSFDGKTPLFTGFEYERQEYIPLASGMDKELANLKKVESGDFTVMNQTADDKKWLVLFAGDRQSMHYYVWDREKQKAELAFVMQESLDRLPLAAQHPLIITSRDGLEMVSYLTLPRDVKFEADSLKPEKPLPMVLVVHGGPWARDSWGFDSDHQWLANRGYAVLSVNYRGSKGFGKKFMSASFGEWGGKMHDDLIDAVDYAVKNGIADKGRVAIMGASYGGYAALLGATFTPDVFKAAVDIVGPANLITSEEDMPSYWKPLKTNHVHRMGADADTEKGRAFLWSRSPLARVDDIKIPLLVGHGDNDPRVKLVEATQIVEAMTKKGLPVTFVRFPDEGHGFHRPENNQSFYAACEIFLSQNLGGRAEPLTLVPGTTMSVPNGADLIPGLRDALEKLKPSN